MGSNREVLDAGRRGKRVAVMAANWIWVTLLALGLVYEFYALANGDPGDTLSERVRAVFRVHTRPGRAIFLVLWLSFAAWFAAHISVKKP
ncbi:hypothetical protein ACFCYF_23630 [Streptomyces chartreusis]|uniref:hypothetical protein n=1 Tax=Streptomyces chartreusis TaxID=1969 RepID=UPI0035DBFEB1